MLPNPFDVLHSTCSFCIFPLEWLSSGKAWKVLTKKKERKKKKNKIMPPKKQAREEGNIPLHVCWLPDLQRAGETLTLGASSEMDSRCLLPHTSG